MATTWWETALADIASALKVPAAQFAEDVAKSLLPTLAADLTPLVLKAVDDELAKYPLAAIIEPEVNAVVANIVNGLVTAVEAKLAELA